MGAVKDVGKEAAEKLKVEARNRVCTELTNNLKWPIKDNAWQACTKAAHSATDKVLASIVAKFKSK